MRHIPFLLRNSIILLIPVLTVSCGENHSLKKETLRFAEENKAWLPADSLSTLFYMISDKGITESYRRTGKDHYFNKSWSSFLGINTDMTFSEYEYQNFISTYGNSFSISLTAGWPPYGDDLYFSAGGVEVRYDLAFHTISRIDWGIHTKSKLMTDEGYEDEGEKILSTVEIFDTLRIDGKRYEKILHFSFLDFPEAYTPLTPRDICISQYYGLVCYTLNNGIKYYRTGK